MTTHTDTIFNSQNTTANLQAMGNKHRAALLAIGLVPADDTGQIDWATITNTPNNTYTGFEMYRFDDALQATHPVFVRLRYYATSNGCLYITFTVGSSTNGAGGFPEAGGFEEVYLTYTTSATHYSSARPIYAWGDGSAFVFVTGYIATSSTSGGMGWFWLDRSRNVIGEPTSVGFAYGGGGGHIDSQNETHLYTYGALAPLVSAVNKCGFPGAMFPSDTLSLANTEDVGFAPSVMVFGNRYHPPSVVGLSCYSLDLPPQTQFQVPLAGATRNFLFLGEFCEAASIAGEGYGANFVNHSFAMRWD